MRYTELLDRFWGNGRGFSHNETILFHYLLYRCSNLGWPDTFSVSNEEIMQTLKVRPDSMREARKGLVDAGLITFQSGTGRGGISYYSLLSTATEKGDGLGTPFCEKGDGLGTPFCEKGDGLGTPFETKRGRIGNTFSEVSNLKSVNKNFEATEKGDGLGTPFCENKEKQNKKDKEIFPEPLKEKKKINKKKTPHNNRVCVHTCESGQEEIVFKEVEKEAKERLNKKPEPPKPNLPDNLEEVIAFFETNAADKIPDWRTEAEAFFYHYESYGWNGTSNRKILDWESKANLWICDKALKHKQTRNNHATTTINNTSNDRAASDREAAELVDRLIRNNKIEGERVSRQVQP